jgi:predicted nucleotidyltransferase
MVIKEAVIAKFLEGCKSLKQKIKAIYFFGSRAKGMERPDSDYDLFLVVTKDFTLSDKDRLYDSVMNVLLDTGKLISLKIFKETVFKKLRRLQTPFIQNVLKEGIKLG